MTMPTLAQIEAAAEAAARLAEEFSPLAGPAAGFVQAGAEIVQAIIDGGDEAQKLAGASEADLRAALATLQAQSDALWDKESAAQPGATA